MCVLETHDNFPIYEHLVRQGLPTVEQLRRGIVLGCIAHSFWLAAEEPVFEQFWEGDTIPFKVDEKIMKAITSMTAIGYVSDDHLSLAWIRFFFASRGRFIDATS